MRWSIIRLIWLRELRTVLMMAVLPLLLYPALGFGVFQFALTYATKTNVVGIYGAENLSPDGDEIRNPKSEIRNTCILLSTCFAAVPVGPGGLDRLAGVSALVRVAVAESALRLPPLLV